MSLRPRSTSIRCSARSFSSAEQLRREPRVLGGGAPAPARARDRAGRRPGCPRSRASVSGEEPEDLRLAGVQVEHVRRGVGQAQRAVERRSARPRLGRDQRRESTIWKHSPARISSRARATAARKRSSSGATVHEGSGWAAASADGQRRRPRLVEGRGQHAPPAGRASPTRRSYAASPPSSVAHGGDQQQALADAVERRDRRVDAEPRVGKAERVREVRRDPLDQPHGVVAEPADRAAGERRAGPRAARGRAPVSVSPQHLERRAVRPRRRPRSPGRRAA